MPQQPRNAKLDPQPGDVFANDGTRYVIIERTPRRVIYRNLAIGPSSDWSISLRQWRYWAIQDRVIVRTAEEFEKERIA